MQILAKTVEKETLFLKKSREGVGLLQEKAESIMYTNILEFL